MGKSSPSRKYRKVARAKREQETRLRITEAAVELHGTVGPANTRISDVAGRAGVSRMTVYNHFPTETDLFVACSTHWASLNPFPDPARWTRVPVAEGRLPEAVGELYRWYGENQGMLGNVFRDTPVLPALSGVMESLWTPYVEAMVDALVLGWPVKKADSGKLRTLLCLVVEFNTWRVLIRSGLDDAASADLVAEVVKAAFPPTRQP